jgi:hypothetical protein
LPGRDLQPLILDRRGEIEQFEGSGLGTLCQFPTKNGQVYNFNFTGSLF